MERIRVLLAVDSAPHAQAFSSCLAAEAPDLELVYFTDEEGRALDSSDVVELLTTIADCEPNVLVHVTVAPEPNFDLCDWILGQFPFLPIVHVNPGGRIRRIRQSVSIEELSNVTGFSPSDCIGCLLVAIRNSTEVDPLSRAVCGKVSEEPVVLSEAFTQIPNP